LGWKRELTQEGIEPNPGPTMNQVKAKAIKAFVGWNEFVEAVMDVILQYFENGLNTDVEEYVRWKQENKKMVEEQVMNIKSGKQILNEINTIADQLKKGILFVTSIFVSPTNWFPTGSSNPYVSSSLSSGPNDFDIPLQPLLRRQDAVSTIQCYIDKDNRALPPDKPSRGMGKTFFLKKIVSEISYFASASSVGWVFSFNLANPDVPADDNLLDFLPN